MVILENNRQKPVLFRPVLAGGEGRFEIIHSKRVFVFFLPLLYRLPN